MPILSHNAFEWEFQSSFSFSLSFLVVSFFVFLVHFLKRSVDTLQSDSVEAHDNDQIRAVEKFSQRGIHLVGWYHSHPRIKPLPSYKDLVMQQGDSLSLFLYIYIYISVEWLRDLIIDEKTWNDRAKNKICFLASMASKGMIVGKNRPALIFFAQFFLILPHPFFLSPISTLSCLELQTQCPFAVGLIVCTYMGDSGEALPDSETILKSGVLSPSFTSYLGAFRVYKMEVVFFIHASLSVISILGIMFHNFLFCEDRKLETLSSTKSSPLFFSSYRTRNLLEPAFHAHLFVARMHRIRMCLWAWKLPRSVRCIDIKMLLKEMEKKPERERGRRRVEGFDIVFFFVVVVDTIFVHNVSLFVSMVFGCVYFSTSLL